MRVLDLQKIEVPNRNLVAYHHRNSDLFGYGMFNCDFENALLADSFLYDIQCLIENVLRLYKPYEEEDDE